MHSEWKMENGDSKFQSVAGLVLMAINLKVRLLHTTWTQFLVKISSLAESTYDSFNSWDLLGIGLQWDFAIYASSTYWWLQI